MEKNKSFLHHFMVIGGGTALNMIVGFLTTPIITRLVGTEEYGQFSIFTMYGSIALMVLCLGLDQALIRFFYRADTDDYRRTILKECWLLPVAACVVVGLIFNALCYTGLLRMEFDNYVVTILTVCVLFQVLNRLDLILLRVSYKTTLYSALQVTYKTLFALLVLAGCSLFKAHFFYIMVIATTFSYFVVTVVGIYSQRDLWAFWKTTEKYEINRKELYLYAFPFIISMGITTFFQAIDKISLNMYCTYSEVGIYSSAMTLVHIFAIVQTTFNSLWLPMVTEHYEKNPEDRDFYPHGNRIIVFVMYSLGLTLILFKDIFALLLGADFREAAFILPFLIFNPIMMTISETTVVGIVFKKKSNMQIVIALIACVTNIIGNTILVPRYGCEGAAISTGVSYIIYFVARTLISNHYFPIQWHLEKFAFITLLTIGYAAYCTFHVFDVLTVVLYLACMVLLCVIYRESTGEVCALAVKYGNKVLKKIIKR